MASKGLALDPNSAVLHQDKGFILYAQGGRLDESIAEFERTLALDPSIVSAVAGLGSDYLYLGQFEKSLEFFDKAIRLSPRDPALTFWFGAKARPYFGLKQYDLAIEWARRAIAINPNNIPFAHAPLIAALALTGHEPEAHEALQRYLALPGGPKTIAAWKAFHKARGVNEHSDPRVLEYQDRLLDGMRKAGMPEE